MCSKHWYIRIVRSVEAESFAFSVQTGTYGFFETEIRNNPKTKKLGCR